MYSLKIKTSNKFLLNEMSLEFVRGFYCEQSEQQNSAKQVFIVSKANNKVLRSRFLLLSVNYSFFIMAIFYEINS